MGLPQTIINFQVLAETLIQRTENGIVALILKDDTATKDLYSYNSFEEVLPSDLWSDTNKNYIKMAFMGGPRKVYIARTGTSTPSLETALKVLGNKLWDYLAYPAGNAGDMTTISTWIKSKRDVDKKTFKAVLSNVDSDHEGVINLTTTGFIDNENKSYTTAEFTSEIAGIVAGIGTTSSVTNHKINNLQSITDLDDDVARSQAIDNGELILVNNGENIVISRGVNSLKTISGNKAKVFKKIRIIEIIDTMKDDIVKIIDEDYRGKVLNTYDNKLLLIGAINSYLSYLSKENVLDINYTNLCQIDYEAQRNYLKTIGVKVDNMEREQILKSITDDKVFLQCNIKTVDAMEDFNIQIYL